MGRVTTLAGALVLCLAVVIPAAIKLACQYDLTKWSVPAGSVAGKTAIVTGANSGLGLETVRVLAAEGASVVLACRSAANCKIAMADIRGTHPGAKLSALVLDLAEPASVKAFAAEFLASHDQLDLLVNNAGIMATPYASAEWPGGTVEKQFATNHLGHFLLTGLLQKVLEATPGARVINHSSSASDMTKRVSDVHTVAEVKREGYDAWDSYCSSKRANRYFTWALNQRLTGVLAVACHPGWTPTNLQHRATGLVDGGVVSKAVQDAWTLLSATMNSAYAQPLNLGAQPQLYAATDKGLKGGEVIGPRWGIFGAPAVETSESCQLGPSGADRCAQGDLDALWTLSERLSAFTYKTHAA